MAINWLLERPDIVEEAETLALLIRETDSSLLAFCLYRSVVDREAAVQALKERLKLPVMELVLSSQKRNPVSLLRTVSADERLCIFFYDVEEALPEAAGYMNLQREAFAEHPHAVIFWVHEYGLREIATHAPDFWSWRSGVFDFRSEMPEMPLTAVQTALAEPLVFHDRDDLKRRISLYQRLFEEHSQQQNPDEHFLSSLLIKLGSAFYLLEDFDKSEDYSRLALERSKLARDGRTESAALHMLGMLAGERLQLDEAEDLYRQSLAISEQIGDDVRIAPTYHQLGTIAQERGQLDQAEEWYRRSLQINERMGLERDAATGYHQLGMIAQERGQLDQAEDWYHRSLQINERMGLERDAATGLAQLGLLRRKQNRLKESVYWFGRALSIAAEYKMRARGPIATDLARTMKAMGEDEFTAAWRQAFEDQEPPLTRLHEILEHLERG